MEKYKLCNDPQIKTPQWKRVYQNKLHIAIINVKMDGNNRKKLESSVSQPSLSPTQAWTI